MILSSNDLDEAAAHMAAMASALGLHPDYLRCEFVLRDTEFGVIYRGPIAVESDAEFSALVTKIERAFTEALREADHVA